MKLYLVRHGHAPFMPNDYDRSLSEQGRAEVKRLAQRLSEYGASGVRICHSGILRAQQTADIIAQHFGTTLVQQIVGLCPEDAVDVLLAQLATWQEDTLLVSHLPYLPHLLMALCRHGESVEFHTAAAVCLESTKDGWRIVKKFL